MARAPVVRRRETEMAETTMVQAVETALREQGSAEDVVAAGQFMPRGHTGSMFAGGLVGDTLGGPAGDLADAVATVGGSVAGGHLHAAAGGVSGNLPVGVTATHVYRFAAKNLRTPTGRRV